MNTVNTRQVYLKCVDLEPNCMVHVYTNQNNFVLIKGATWEEPFKDMSTGVLTAPIRAFKVRNGILHVLLEESKSSD